MGQRQDAGHPEEGAPVAHPCQPEAPTGPLRARLGLSSPSSHPCHSPGKCLLECLLMSQEQAAQGPSIPCTKWRERWSSQESQCQTIGTTSQCLPTASSAPSCEVLCLCLGAAMSRCHGFPRGCIPASGYTVSLPLATMYPCSRPFSVAFNISSGSSGPGGPGALSSCICSYLCKQRSPGTPGWSLRPPWCG